MIWRRCSTEEAALITLNVFLTPSVDLTEISSISVFFTFTPPPDKLSAVTAVTTNWYRPPLLLMILTVSPGFIASTIFSGVYPLSFELGEEHPSVEMSNMHKIAFIVIFIEWPYLMPCGIRHNRLFHGNALFLWGLANDVKVLLWRITVPSNLGGH